MGGLNAICWLIIFLICLVAEIISLGLTTIWFAAGALLAFVVALIGANLLIQIVLFVAVSLILLFVTRPIATKYLNSNISKTNVDELIGKTAKVISRIDNNNELGEAKINSELWIARSKDGKVIEEGTTVTIVEIKGVKLIVEEQ